MIKYTLRKFVSTSLGLAITTGVGVLATAGVVSAVFVPLSLNGAFSKKVILAPQLNLSNRAKNELIKKDKSAAWQIMSNNLAFGEIKEPAQINAFEWVFNFDEWKKRAKEIGLVIKNRKTGETKDIEHLSDVVVILNVRSINKADNTTMLSINLALKPDFSWSSDPFNKDDKAWSVNNAGNSKLTIKVDGFSAQQVFIIDPAESFINWSVFETKYNQNKPELTDNDLKQFNGQNWDFKWDTPVKMKILSKFLDTKKTGSEWADSIGFADPDGALNLYEAINNSNFLKEWKTKAEKTALYGVINMNAIKVSDKNNENDYSKWTKLDELQQYYFYSSLNTYNWVEKLNSIIKFEFDNQYRGGLFDFSKKSVIDKAFKQAQKKDSNLKANPNFTMKSSGGIAIEIKVNDIPSTKPIKGAN